MNHNVEITVEWNLSMATGFGGSKNYRIFGLTMVYCFPHVSVIIDDIQKVYKGMKNSEIALLWIFICLAFEYFFAILLMDKKQACSILKVKPYNGAFWSVLIYSENPPLGKHLNICSLQFCWGFSMNIRYQCY